MVEVRVFDDKHMACSNNNYPANAKSWIHTHRQSKYKTLVT